jgi:hypothetical protein
MAILIEAWSQILAIPVFSPREINTLDVGVQAIARDAVAALILSLPTLRYAEMAGNCQSC